MKIIRAIPWWALILGLLLLADFFWYAFAWYTRWHENTNLRAAAQEIKVVTFHTNDMSGVGIVEVKTDNPLWIEWHNHDGNPDQISYFFHGTNVFNLHLKEGQPPRYDVVFHGPGKSEVWWWDNGSGSFTERISYDANGNRSGFEVWYDGAWHPVDRRNKMNGIVINSQWFHLKLDTNGIWTTEAATTVSTNQF